MSTTGEMKMAEEQEDYSRENKRRMIVALAILLGAKIENAASSYSSIPEEIKTEAAKLYKSMNMDLVTEQPARIPEQQVQIQAATAGKASGVQLYKIVGSRDDKTCPDCAAWQGKTVSMTDDGQHQTVQDFINNHGFHVNCRCSLQELSTKEIPLNKLNPRYEARKAANPAVYHCAARFNELVFT